MKKLKNLSVTFLGSREEEEKRVALSNTIEKRSPFPFLKPFSLILLFLYTFFF